MNYAALKKFDIANGPGVRVSLFVSGCRHHCKGCFNAEAWDFNFGKPMTNEVEEEILNACSGEHISGLSLLGGEPFEKENRKALIALTQKFKDRYPDKTIWCYTGFVLEEELLSQKDADIDELLSQIDVLVDGRFVDALKSPALLFRGSSNQRIIDMKKTLENKKTILLEGKWERRMGSTNIDE